MRDVCIDANVMVKVAVPESFSKLAEALIADSQAGNNTLIAPHFFEAEVLSAFRRKVKDGVLTESDAQKAIKLFKGIPVQLIHFPTLAERAFAIATQYNWRYVYDAFYVALAEQRICELWTADENLVNDVSHVFPFVKWLGNYTPKATSS